MAKIELKCPSCGSDIELGDIKCHHCGTNLKSGETFETQLKRARGHELHPERYASGMFLGSAVALALILVAGYMYQRRQESVITERPDLFGPPIVMMQLIDDRVTLGQYDAARSEGGELLQWMQVRADAIKPSQPFSEEDENQRRFTTREKKYNKRAGKSLMTNLLVKAQRQLDSIPAS